MILRGLLILLLASGCGRPLTESEKTFALSIQGDQLDVDRVRLVKGAPVGSFTFKRKARPRLTCRERILPAAKEEIVTVSPAAVTLFNTVYFTKDWYTTNYQPDFPDQIHLVAAMLFAHEMTHVWQWQNRDRTGFSPWVAAAEHGHSDDPYLFDLNGAPEFLSYGYEQQGAIVEEYVCCRALDPDAARTKRLHTMLSGAFPVSDLPGEWKDADVGLPWKDAKISGICS
ncbi:MAG: hypothetical protein KUG70_00935 [Rhodobacteraceae bacterium]|nr:hypothetical protein [Paracoccaceae bacterium]